MAGPYTIATPVKGQQISSAAFGQAVKDAINDLHTRVAALETDVDPIVRLVQSNAPQSLTSGLATPLQFDAASEIFATPGFHNGVTNNTRITPNIPGYYEFHGTASFAVGSSNYVQILAAIAKNGIRQEPQSVLRPDAGTAATSSQTVAILASNGTTDYFDLYGGQNSSGAQNTNSTSGMRSCFECIFLRPL